MDSFKIYESTPKSFMSSSSLEKKNVSPWQLFVDASRTKQTLQENDYTWRVFKIFSFLERRLGFANLTRCLLSENKKKIVSLWQLFIDVPWKKQILQVNDCTYGVFIIFIHFNFLGVRFCKTNSSSFDSQRSFLLMCLRQNRLSKKMIALKVIFLD